MSTFTTITQQLQRCFRHRHLPLPVLVRFFGRDATRSAAAKNPKGGVKANAYSVAYAPGDKFQNVEKLFRLLGFTGAIGTAAYFILPNVYVWQVQQFYQHHSKGVPTRVPHQLKALVLEVMDEVMQQPKEGVLGSDVQVNAFIGVPSEPFVYGTISGGFQLMLPDSMMFASEKEFDLSKWQSGAAGESSTNVSQAVQNTDDHGLSLKQSILLTEEAKKFLIAREIERVKSNYFYPIAIYPAVNVVCCFYVYKRVVEKLGLRGAPKAIRLLWVALSALSWTALTILAVDSWRKKIDRKVDAAACAHGPAYARGGFEYYTKILSRNIALRNIMPGGKGKKTYNLKGEKIPGFIRRKHVPFAERRAICEKALQG